MPRRPLFRRSLSTQARRERTNLRKILGASHHAVERLETRRLLTTLSAPAGFHDTFDFFTPYGDVVRIAYSGITFEAIGVAVDKTSGQLTIADLTQETQRSQTPPANITFANLFSIYVLQSDIDSYISIAELTQPAATSPDIEAMRPFASFSGNIHVNEPATGLGLDFNYTPSPDSGAAYLGARTASIQNAFPPGDTPITEVADPGPFGVYPGNVFGDGFLHAGLFVGNDATTGLPQDLGKFFFGGVITGQVQVSGNMHAFYAGDILTGTGDGILQARTATSTADEPINFFIGGDVQNFVTDGDIGGSHTTTGGSIATPNYETGFNGVIEGKVGQFFQRQGDLIGSLRVVHNPNIPGLSDNDPNEELEFKNTDVFIFGDPGGIGQIFEGANGYLTALDGPHLPAPFTNDTSDTAQYLGSSQETDGFGNLVTDAAGKPVYQSDVEGILQNGTSINFRTGDPADWYAVSLLGGQTVSVSLLVGTLGALGPNTGEATVIVQDPDGRTIFSDAPLQAASPATGGGFQFTPDRPGIYRFEIREEQAAQGVDLNYSLQISGTGDMAMGEMVVAGEIHDAALDASLVFDTGDVGAIVSGENIVSSTRGPTPVFGQNTAVAPISILLANGDLRALIAASIGVIGAAPAANEGQVFSDFPYLDVADGNVGLIQATDPAGILAIQTRFFPILPATPLPNTPESPVGKSIQTIDGLGVVYLQIAVDQGIGNIDAGQMTTNPASFIEVNADNSGNDGTIDLIDCTGDLGTLQTGGPGFVTNNGGNIRYMEVGGTIYKDAFFGGSALGSTTYNPGQAVNLTDDSGTPVTITPVGPLTTTTTIDPTTNLSTTVTTGPQLTLETYPVRDKAGVIIVNAVSTGSVAISANGSAGRGALATAEISRLELQGEGVPITAGAVDSFGNTTITQVPATVTGTVTNDLSAIISGSATVDVFNIVVTGSTAAAATTIANNTPGEIVNINAPNIGNLSSNGTIGLAKHFTGAALAPSEVIAAGNAYPFVQQHFGVQVAGDIVSVTARGGVGNFAVGVSGAATGTAPLGTIGSLIANFGGKPIPGQFSGINGPIVAGRILSVDVGQGILPTGTGTVGFAGLYATGKIGIVTGSNAAIRGNIVSNETDPTQVGIDEIALNSSSIIGAKIECVTAFDMSSDEPPEGILVPVPVRVVNPPLGTTAFDIGLINVQGNGGIIGSEILASDIGPIIVGKSGFGILSSTITNLITGRISTITAGGYGLRDDFIGGGGFVDGLNATGNGSQISVKNFSINVRESETGGFDPFFGYSPSNLTDLDAFLGTSAISPIIPGVTDSGIIEDVEVAAERDLGSVAAQQIRAKLPLGTTLNIPVTGQTFETSFNLGNSIGSIKVRGAIDGLQITTGHLGTFTQGKSVSRLGISVSGSIDNLTIHGNYGQSITDPNTLLTIPDSYIQATGPDGTIKSLTITGNLNGNVTAEAAISRMTVGGNVVGNITALGNTTGLTLGTLRIGGTVNSGTLNIDGNAGSIITNGSLGAVSDSLTIVGNLDTLTVGANHGAGHNLNAAVHIEGNLNKFTVFGQVNGSFAVDGNLKTMKLVAFGVPGNITTAPISVGGRLTTASISNGNLASSIIVNGSINNFTLSHGSVAVGASIQSSIEAIHNFKITGGAQYGMFGTLLASNGLNEKIDISGNIGDGINAAHIVALSGSTFHIRGTISSTGTITVQGPLDSLLVDGDVAAGAVVTAHPLRKLKVRGTNQGTITAV